MPTAYAAALGRARARKQAPGAAPASARPPVAAAHPLSIPRLDLPLVLRVERTSRSLAPVQRQTWEAQLRRLLRAGALRSTDSSNNSEGFLNLALSRVLPRAPVFKGFDVNPRFVFQEEVLCEQMDPGGYHGVDDRFKGGRSWITLHVGHHLWCPVGQLFAVMEERHPGFGRWLCWALRSPLVIHPHEYIAWIGAAHWYGEVDEQIAKEEYEANCEEDENGKPIGYRGPTRADFDKLIPKWAQRSNVNRAEHARFLALCRRVFRVDCSPLFNARGQHVLDRKDFIYPGGYLDAYERPIVFGWTNGDLVLESIDYAFNQAAQCDGVPDVVTAFCADDLKVAAAKLATTWRVLSTLGALAVAFDKYRKDHKIV
jgi:hypothetical protein